MVDVWLVPYLPLSAEVALGPWTLIPFRDFKQRHTRGRGVFTDVRRLITAYRLKDTLAQPFGAVILPSDGRIGDDIQPDLLAPLQRALALALIDMNPSFLVGDEEQPNAGHAMASADNGRVFAHSVQGDGRYAFVTGAMVRRLNFVSVSPGRRLPRVAPPPELPTPILGRGFDEDYATALYATLTTDDTPARLLDRCIQWLVLAWSNSEVVGEDTRILAFRAAFEVLLGGDSQTRECGRALSKLLGDDGQQQPRSWIETEKQRHMALNDTEWWFQSFTLLRNAIAHGDEISGERWLFDDGKRHLWHADERLRCALKRTIIAARSDPDLELDPLQRLIKRGYERIQAPND